MTKALKEAVARIGELPTADQEGIGRQLLGHVEAWAIRRNETKRELVTEGNFTYVALDDAGRPRKVG